MVRPFGQNDASSRRRGFTLIEILVVLLVIMLLMGLLMASIGAIRRQSMNTRTRATLAMIANAAAAAGSTKSQTLATVEHPLAASAATRTLFVRKADGSAVATAGMAIRSSDIAYVAVADRSRALFADDVFADPIAPQFVGLPRWRMAVLGATSKWVSQWTRISGPGQAGMLIEPDLGIWVDEGFLRQAVTTSTDIAWDKAADKAMSVAIGASVDELLTQGAYWRPDVTRDPLILGDRLRHDRSPDANTGDGYWSPGMVNSGGTFVTYRIRGPSLLDAWKREILISTAPSGALRIESAGADGVFCWHPGQNRTLQTDARATSPAGDDSDGRSDNLFVGPEE